VPHGVHVLSEPAYLGRHVPEPVHHLVELARYIVEPLHHVVERRRLVEHVVVEVVGHRALPTPVPRTPDSAAGAGTQFAHPRSRCGP